MAFGTRGILAGFLAMVSCAGAAGLSQDTGFHATVGAEYQYISQRYYTAVLDTISMDVIETWYLDRDEIDDFIARTSLGYGFDNTIRRANVLADIEVSEDRLLWRSEGSCRFGKYGNHFKLFGKLEARSPYDEDNDRVDGYNYYQTYLSGNLKIAERAGLNGKIGYERVSFSERQVVSVDTGTGIPTQSFPLYDYSLLTGQIGGEYMISEFGGGFLWRAAYTRRNVPDSGEVDYNQYRFNLEYSYGGLNGFTSLFGEIERQDYSRASGEDDFTSYSLGSRASRIIFPQIEATLYLNADFRHFSLPDPVNRNHSLIMGELKATHRIKDFGWGPLVRLERRHENILNDNDLESFSESYDQTEAGMHLDLSNLTAIFADIEAAAGSRHYDEAAGIISSYDYITLSALISCRFLPYMSFQAMFDGDWEKHAKEEDNSNFYLLTAGVSLQLW